ncbi:orotidine-5'-phosphate decarboxylase [Sporobacter termitidis DSM 10068]|uniref:Orotidine 5'-phosphate decarboxylase n=1 Tax=Sporobacter termitidis DSM 10068 TaxID=1123282 RepID=A0A1M5WFK5_9FIRM|nr:orotidine-5'-phosphate decarboxylase [Sporobacter termitidis]SHH86023.1 orotidine-5'-phosphate decarboxylase [Sporobacter termitidis DSM 10068]
MSFDILQEKIIALKNPTVAGLDPLPDYVPKHIMDRHLALKGETLEAAADAYFEFNRGLIDALCDIVPAVKPQSAYYELLGPAGVAALAKTAAYAKAKGLYVIADVKRNDIGSTAEAYSAAYLGTVKIGGSELAPFDFDAATINGYLGTDGIAPFLETCRRRNKAVFVLVKTSNPSSAELQDLQVGERKLYEAAGDLIEALARDTAGKYGYTCAGAVVGATYPEELKSLRRRLKNTFFLVPGYGAQGGGAGDVAGAFDENGRGAVINSSRAIICAWKKTGRDGLDFAEAARAEAIKMRGALRECVDFR